MHPAGCGMLARGAGGMNVLLYPNATRDHGLACTGRIVEKLYALGAVPMLDSVFKDAVDKHFCQYGAFTDLLAEADVIMPVGGDGTVMRTVKYAVSSGKPILAVNAGHVGFLTEMEAGELDCLSLLVEGKYTVHPRMLLEAELEQEEGGRQRFIGLNDVVIERGDIGRSVGIAVRQQGMLISRHRADGVLFATATGSTAYSLAAGGPLVDPGLSLLLLTWICAHTLGGTSIILSTEQEYTVEDCSPDNPKGLAVTVDGRRVGCICGNRKLTIRKAQPVIHMIDLGRAGFFQKVNDKLSWGR